MISAEMPWMRESALWEIVPRCSVARYVLGAVGQVQAVLWLVIREGNRTGFESQVFGLRMRCLVEVDFTRRKVFGDV